MLNFFFLPLNLIFYSNGVQAGASPYSIITGITLPLVDITFDFDHWKALIVDTVQSFRGRIPNTNIYQENSPKLTRNTNGDFILYTWVDTRSENQTSPGSNEFPDLFVKGYFVDAKMFYYKKQCN